LPAVRTDPAKRAGTAGAPSPVGARSSLCQADWQVDIRADIPHAFSESVESIAIYLIQNGFLHRQKALIGWLRDLISGISKRPILAEDC